MDPKQQLNQLDPKLKEAYERVMGTPVGTTPQQAAPTPAASQGMPNPGMAQPVQPTQPVMPMQQPQMPQATPAAPMHPVMPQPQPMPVAPQMQYPQQAMPTASTPGMAAHPQMPAVTPANPFGAPIPQPTTPGTHPAAPAAAKPATPGSHGFVAGKKGFKVSPVVLIAGGLVFLVVYTIFWLKFFNIPLPFLGQ